jgi:glutathione S-transferase
LKLRTNRFPQEEGMLKIWGRNNSVNVQKVLWCCEELGLKYERIDAGGQFGVVNTPQYRALNPNGLVPTLEDGPFVLWESNAIVRYLTAKHSAGKMWPEDLKIRAEADKWMDWQCTTFWPAFRPLFWNLVRTPADQRDERAMEESRLGSAEVLGYLDAHLKHRTYVAGDELTMGDIPMGCAVWRWFGLHVERPDLPHLQRWFDNLRQRPAYQTMVMLPLT